MRAIAKFAVLYGLSFIQSIHAQSVIDTDYVCKVTLALNRSTSYYNTCNSILEKHADLIVFL